MTDVAKEQAKLAIYKRYIRLRNVTYHAIMAEALRAAEAHGEAYAWMDYMPAELLAPFEAPPSERMP